MSQYPYQSQPAWIDGRTADSAERERTFIRSVYMWMFVGLMVTAAIALVVVSSPSMQQKILASRGAWIVLSLLELGIVAFLSFRITKMSATTAAISFLAFSALNGLTMSWIFFAFTTAAIYQAFFTSAGMFAAMSVYGHVTKRDLTSWGSFFFMGLIGIIICSVVNMFLHSPGLSFAVSIIGVFVFLGLTAYDTQKLKAFATVPQLSGNLAIFGALTLYLDFVNLFLFLLRIFGGGRDRR